MNRRTLFKRAAALVLAPSLAKLAPELPASSTTMTAMPIPAGRFVSPDWTGEQMVVTGFRTIPGATWLDDEIVPVYSQLRLEHARALERRVWIGEDA